MKPTLCCGLLAGILIPCCYGGLSEFNFIHLIRGNQDDKVFSVALGPDRSIYVAGTTNSTDFDTTPGSVRPSVQIATTAVQAFLRRLSSDGSQVLFSALLGPCTGNVALAVDPQGNAYVAIESANSNWAAPVRPLEPQGSVTLLKISAAGDRMLYGATLLSEGFYGPPLALAVDATGAAYVGTGQGTAAIRKVDVTGQSIAYRFQITCSNPYFSPVVNALAVGPDRSLYIAGRAACTGFPTTPGAWRTSTANPQNADGYLVRLKPDGSAPMYSTLVGGESQDEVFSLAVDASGRAIVVGSTGISTGLAPMSAQPIGFTPGINLSYGFLAAFDPTGSTLEYSFLLPSDLSAVTLDDLGRPLVAGTTAAGVALANVDPKTASLLFWLNPPAASARIPSIVSNGGTVVFGGWTTSLGFPDGNPNQFIAGRNGFVGAIVAHPAITDLALTTTATAARPDIYGSINSCLFRIQNLGPTAADDIVLLAGDSLFTSWQASPDGFVVPSLWTGIAGPAHVLLPHLEPGRSAEIAFQGPAQCTGSVQTSTAESNLSNNRSSDLYQPIPMVAFNLTSGVRGVQFQRDDWPALLTTGSPSSLPVPVGGDIRIYFPSPQTVNALGAVTFRSWADGVTDNPRTFHVSDRSITASANFSILTTPWFDPTTSVLNAATSLPGPVAPGELVVLYGVNLGSGTLAKAGVDPDGRLARQLGGYSVTFDGQPAPFLYASYGQTSVFVPYEIAGKSSVQIVVDNGKGASFSGTISVTDTSPGLFTANSSGTGQAVAVNQNGSLNNLYNPAARGEIVVLYATGEGVSSPALDDGAIVGASLPQPVAGVTVTIGGQKADVLYAGGAPGLAAGVMQLNVRIPAGIAPGSHVPVVLSAGQNSSRKGVIIAVR